ncbi:hypothetical protein POJ06DRAFT_97386 [Lipomyces tetrasporus]|uniref:Uncharacterized protein n=1 Tax=Lipomyces tetrasporus TaxID=54092 RepID=A0AAD7QTZ0_9ASCO|nr:uncharacterized protein POJ06DRAFT_97386 [Lipomyces tetrasporus]KAJ8101457.1 hypothetical protein POJ06DRAFT_97386 [Lipomyces tetrasporus]
MEILHVSASASHSQSQVSSHVPRGTPQSNASHNPTSILGKRRRLGDYYYHNARLVEDSSSEFNSSVCGEDSVESDADRDTARDELSREHLLDRIREDQFLLSQVHGDRSSLSHSTTSTSVDSGNSGNYSNLNRSSNAAGSGDGDKRDFLSTISGLSEVSAVATTQDRYVKLAAAAASFVPCRRHFVHKFHVDVRGFELPADKSIGYSDASEKTDSQVYEGEPERRRLDGIGHVKEHTLVEPMSARSSGSEISPKMDYSELIRTLHSDSVIPDSCPGSVAFGHEEMYEEDTTDALALCNLASSRVEQHDASSSTQTRRGPVSTTATGEPDIQPFDNNELVLHDIDLSHSFRFWNPPPKYSSLALAGKPCVAPASSPPLTHHQSHPQNLSPSNLAPPRTPVQACRSSSQLSSFTSPDRIPTRMPLFGATLSLAQMLGKDHPHAVYYPPDSSSTDNGSDASEDHNLRSSGGAFLSSRTEPRCSPRAKIKIVTRTLKKQMHIAFRKKDYYTPRARCVRFLPDERDGCIDGSRKLGENQWPPEKLERGYWRVDVSTWPTNEKMKFWDNITQAIRAGRLGWIGAVVEGANENGNGEIVRVYCFGGAVVHIWVFLFAMSDRRTLTNVRWIDGVGRTVIEVGEEVPT